VKVGLFTRTAEQCGIAVYSRRYAEALARRPEVEVEIVDAGLPPDEAAARLNALDVAHIQHAYSFWGRLAWHRSSYGRFVHGLRSPAVVTVHELVEPAGSLPRRQYIRWLNRRHFLAEPIREWIAHSQPVVDGLRGIGAPPERVHLLPMPPPPALRLPPRADARHRLGLPAGAPVVGIFGFLVERKGYDRALRAIAEIPDATLLLAGGPHPDEHDGFGAALAAAVRGSEGTRFPRSRFPGLAQTKVTGFLDWDGVADAMAAIDLAWAPFREMAASASVAELLAHGVPVIAADLPALRHLAGETAGVECVPAGEWRALAAATRALLASPTERATRRAEALRYADRISYDGLAEATLPLYRRARHAART
jgi:glycosyltransferase involved in cell wall biosynthesis